MADKGQTATVKIHLDEETGLHYLIGREYVLFENDVRVRRYAFDNRVRDGKDMTQLVTEAKLDPENRDWDFRTACKTANLVKKQPQIRKPTTMPRVAEKKPKTAQIAQPVDIVKEVTERAKGFFSAPHADIVVIATVIGIACAFMSMYHAYVFLHDVNGKPPVVAFITAFTMVLFAASAFTIARHLGGDDKIGFGSRIVFPPVFTALGLGVIWFLVFSTITVNYEQFTARDTVKEQAFVEKDTGVKTTTAALGTKDTEITNAEAEVTRLTGLARDWYAAYMKPVPDVVESDDEAVVRRSTAARNAALAAQAKAYTQYNNANTELKGAVAKRDKLLGDKGSLIAKAETVTTTAKDKRETVYTIVQKKTGITESTLQFLIYVIPPTFFDVVSPVTLSVVLLLRDRRRDKCDAVKKRGVIDALKKLFSREA